MPFQPDAELLLPAPALAETSVVSSDWSHRLPLLAAGEVTLRELTMADAPALCALLTTEEVSRFITPPPTTVAGFEKFIEWTHKRRAEGTFVCFGVVPKGMTTAVGIFQVRSLEADFSVAEWGFALGSEYWGTGIFGASAQAVMDFAFDVIGIHRLEARASVENARGNGALRKLGAVPEAILRDAFLKDGVHHDQVLWALLVTDRTPTGPAGGTTIH